MGQATLQFQHRTGNFVAECRLPAMMMLRPGSTPATASGVMCRRTVMCGGTMASCCSLCFDGLAFRIRAAETSHKTRLGGTGGSCGWATTMEHCEG